MRIILIPAVIAVAAIAACGNGNGSGDSSGKLGVVASFYPLAEAARRVGGARVQVKDLTPAGVEPHDVELTPDRLERVLEADVVLVMGRDFQPSVEEAADRSDAEVVEVLPALGARGDDPHVWLDPTRMARIVDLVRDALIKADPTGAAGFRSRGAAFRTELDALDHRYATTLTGCRERTIVTAHEAFGWLARRYHLKQEAVTGLSPEAEPDPKRLASLTDDIKERRVTTVFTETLLSKRIAQALAREAGVRTAVLNPVEGLTAADQHASRNYVSIMDDNLKVLAGALGC